MDIKKVTASLSVSPQITQADIPTIISQGYKTLICNRPDNEGEDQINVAEIENLVSEQGMRCYYLPVTPGKVSVADAEAMHQLLTSCEQPVLAYCRTGMRSILLWALYQANSNEASSDALKKHAKQIGYDLEAFLS